MNQYEVIISEKAQQDLREIVANITRQAQQKLRVEENVNNLAEIISNLARAPFRHPLVNDERLVTAGIRRLEIDNYIVFFIASEKEKTVSVIRILHDQRYWTDLI